MQLSPQRQQLMVVGALLSWCTFLLLRREELLTHWIGLGLLWNLLLAALPLFWGAAFEHTVQLRLRFLSGLYFVLWLLFLPNAPYLVTDLMHLNTQHRVDPWYVLAVLLSLAGTGTLLCYVSLANVHGVVERHYGRRMGWTVAAGSLWLCGFGIYIGRYLRWNSWNAFNRPLELVVNVAQRLVNPGDFPHPVAVTLVYGTGLLLGYMALRVLAVGRHTGGSHPPGALAGAGPLPSQTH